MQRPLYDDVVTDNSPIALQRVDRVFSQHSPSEHPQLRWTRYNRQRRLFSMFKLCCVRRGGDALNWLAIVDQPMDGERQYPRFHPDKSERGSRATSQRGSIWCVQNLIDVNGLY